MRKINTRNFRLATRSTPREVNRRIVLNLIREYQPSAVAIEALFFGRNVTTAISVGQARGVAVLAAAHCGVPIAE